MHLPVNQNPNLSTFNFSHDIIPSLQIQAQLAGDQPGHHPQPQDRHRLPARNFGQAGGQAQSLSRGLGQPAERQGVECSPFSASLAPAK